MDMDQGTFAFDMRLTDDTVSKFFNQHTDLMRMTVPGEGIQDRATWRGWPA